MQKELVGHIVTQGDLTGLPAGVPGTPSAQDLERIRPFMLTDPDPSQLYVRRLILANDAPDREHERFPKRVLEQIAKTLPGKSLLISHEKKQLPLGLFFDAQLRKAAPDEDGSWVVEAAFYLVANETNKDLRQQIDAGVVRYASVGSGWDTKTCDICGADYEECPHYKGQKLSDGRIATVSYGGDLAKYEAREGSLVYLGAQHGATIKKQFKGEPMDLEKIAAQLETLTKSVGERFEKLEKDPSAAEKSAAGLTTDGETYRTDLRADTLRLAKLLEKEEQADLILKAMPDAPVAALKQIRDGYQKDVDQKFPPRPQGHLEKLTDDDAPTGSSPSARVALL